MNNSVFSPAKINLTLNILKLREDNYHELDSVFAKINFGDYLTFTEKKESIEIKSKGEFKIPTNKDNLVFKAADLLRTKAKGKKGIKIEIEKNIPIGSGLGGGSSNAATTLKFLNTFWDINLSNDKLCEIGAKIGADVPFFINELTFAHISGIGDKIEKVIYPREIFGGLEQTEIIVLLIIPKYISINTSWAYSELKKYFKEKYPNSISNSNTFEKIIFEIYPDLKFFKETFLNNGAIHSNMTGSGSAVFGIFEKSKNLLEIEKKLKNKGDLISCAFSKEV